MQSFSAEVVEALEHICSEVRVSGKHCCILQGKHPYEKRF